MALVDKLSGPSLRSWVCCALLAWCAPTLGQEPVAMVTDLQGAAELQWSESKGHVALLSELTPGALITLGDQARLVLVYFASGDEFAYKGPAQIYIRDDQPVTLEGQAPSTTALFKSSGLQAPVKPLGLAQAGLVMRASNAGATIRLVEPAGTKVLGQPVFRWESPAAESYEFELTDSAGRKIFETTVTQATLRLPDQVQLEAGRTYSWEVEARLRGGGRYASWADFRLADSDEVRLAEQMRPAPDAPFSRRVAYAAWLEQMDLKDEARKYWTALSSERPDNEALRRLANE
jgi:hypothetical protein